MLKNDIKRNIAENIIRLRTMSGLTQAQFAEKLHYTDKAVSKWERAESVPDIAVLKEIADMFGVTVDAMISDTERVVPRDEKTISARKQNKILIALLSCAGVWLVTIAAFVVLRYYDVPRVWIVFIWGAFATAADLLVFNAVWGKYHINFVLISLLIWTLLAALYVTIADWSAWMMFLIGIPLQFAVIFWSQIKIAITPKKK